MSQDLDFLPGFLRPKLHIFLSVDIVGSTQFKQHLLNFASRPGKEHPLANEGHPSEAWLSPILKFYDQISSIFRDNWLHFSKQAQSTLRWETGDAPWIWKAVGDELIFTKPLKSGREALICVVAWTETVRQYRRLIKVQSQSLDLKCASWIAGFPVNNAEIILDQQPNMSLAEPDDGDYIFGNLLRLERSADIHSGIKDYIGPSLDTGFRVATNATPRKFVITADLALMLSHTAATLPNVDSCLPQLNIFFEGRKSLKGVTDGTPYPLFWIDASDSSDTPLNAIEDELENRQRVEFSKVKEFCEHFLNRNKETHVMRPYIYGDPDPFFEQIPQGHVEKLRVLANYWKNEKTRRENEQKAQMDQGDALLSLEAPSEDTLAQLISDIKDKSSQKSSASETSNSEDSKG